jgi:hypothetical protein
VLNVIFSTPMNASVGLGIVVLGIPVYFLWRSRNPANPIRQLQVEGEASSN